MGSVGVTSQGRVAEIQDAIVRAGAHQSCKREEYANADECVWNFCFHKMYFFSAVRIRLICAVCKDCADFVKSGTTLA